MSMKTYQAYSMAQALAAVKQDLGADAVIVHTRSFRRGGILGLGAKTIIEVSAMPGDEARAQQRAAAAASPSRSKASGAAGAYSRNGASPRRASHRPSAERAADERAAESLAPASGMDLLRRLQEAGVSGLDENIDPVERRTPAAEAAGVAEAASTTPRPAPVPADTAADQARPAPRPAPASSRSPSRAPEPSHAPAPAPAPAVEPSEPSERSGHERTAPLEGVPAAAEPERQAASAGNAAPAARRFILQAASEEIAAANRASVCPSVSPATADEASPKPSQPDLGRRTTAPTSSRAPIALFDEGDDAAVEGPAAHDAAGAMHDELTAIRNMVAQVLQRQSLGGSGRAPMPTMPQHLFDMYLKLVGQDMSEELADRIVNHVRDELTESDLHDAHRVRDAALRHLADYIPTAEQAVATQTRSDRPLTIALVGPTGVGKTTTLAKIAASFKLRHHKKVGLITADTYRIAAVDQLRTYANIIGLPLQVVLTPSEMRQAVHALSDCDVILIDTAGRSQNDVDRIGELRQFIAAAAPHEVHLVLSGTASERVLLREAEAFGTVGVDKIVLTKLDEAVSFGMLVDVVRQVGKELSFITTGQEVPDHIEVGRPERLAEMILGGERET